ncbi:MAG: nuclear transport factor 2 family protein [Acidimicrobiales bacterium]
MALSVEDQLAIRDLAARYNHAIDSGDGVAYADTFVDGGVLDAGELVLQGRDALGAFASSFAASVRSPRHIATSLVIDGEGDHAELRAYVQMLAMVGEPPRHQITASGTYDDTLVRLGGAWRFVRRTFTGDG